MESTLTPEASAAIQTPATGAASPAAGAAHGDNADATLSTASLSDSIRKQLTGEKTPTPTPADGPESSPAAGQPTDTSTPAAGDTAPPTKDDESIEDDEEDKDRIAAFPKEAVAALATQRKQKKELKAQLKATTEELGALKAKLAQTSGQPDPAAAEAADAQPSTLTAQPSPELAQAEQVVKEQEDLRNWARKETRTLQQAIAAGADTTALLANLQARVTEHKISLPADPEGVLAWLDGVQTTAADALEAARGDVRFLRQQTEQQATTLRSEGEAFAREFVPKAFEPGTEEHKRFTVIKQLMPGIEKHPRGMRFIAAAIRGWDVIKTEIEGKAKPGTNGKPANGTPTAGAAAVALPAKAGARLPGTPALVPTRPEEGAESSSAIFKRYQAALADPNATEQERARLKHEWVKAGVSNR